VAQFQSGDFPKAEKSMRSVIAASPTFILAYTHLATMYKEMGKSADAVRVLELGLEKNPGDILLLAKLGIVLADSGNWRRAIPILEFCVRKEDFDPERFNFLGIAYYQGGDFTRALQNYEKALELDRNNASVYSNIGGVHLALFQSSRQQKELVLAESSFNKALEIDPRLFSACNGLGIVCRKTGRNAEAIEYWRKALAIKPDYDLALLNLGITLLEENRAAEALECFNSYREKFYYRIGAGEQQRLDRLIAEARAKLPAG
jgi:Flp pilus assembly protein TadD